MNTEVRVGLLFFLCMGLGLWFALFVTDLGHGPGDFAVDFERVYQLESGDDVTYAGVVVGRVASVLPVVEGGKVRVRVRFDIPEHLRPAVLISDDTQITIDQGLLGSSRLAIVGNGNGRPIGSGVLAGLDGRPPANLSQLIAEAVAVIQENRESIRTTLATLPEAVANFASLGEDVGSLVADNRAALNETIAGLRELTTTLKDLVAANRDDIEATVTRLAALTEEVQAMVAENRQPVRAAIAQLPAAAEHFATLGEDLRSLVGDNRERIDTLLASLGDLAPRLDRISQDVAAITGQVASGQGTVGKLLFEEEVYDSTQRVLEGAEQRVDEVKEFTGGFALTEFYGGIESGYNPVSELGYHTAYVRIEPKPWRAYSLGVTYRSLPEGFDDLSFLDQRFSTEALLDPTLAYGLYLYRRTEAEDTIDDLERWLGPNATIGFRFFPDDGLERYRLHVEAGLVEGQFGARAEWALSQDFTAGVMLRAADDSELPDGTPLEGGGVFGRAWIDWKVWRGITLRAGGDDLFDAIGPYLGLQAELLDQDIRNLFSAASLL